jgi:hypothetical protein
MKAGYAAWLASKRAGAGILKGIPCHGPVGGEETTPGCGTIRMTVTNEKER